MSEEYTLLPRWEIREEQCRKFEKLISQALELGTQVVDVQTWIEANGGRRVSPRTLVCRINDAILGFRRYKYTNCFPSEADLGVLVAREAENGKVVLRNKASEQGGVSKVPESEVKRLLEGVTEDSSPLEIACGNGETAERYINLARMFPKVDQAIYIPRLGIVKVFPKREQIDGFVQ
jgi:hypothetical protein